MEMMALMPLWYHAAHHCVSKRENAEKKRCQTACEELLIYQNLFYYPPCPITDPAAFLGRGITNYHSPWQALCLLFFVFLPLRVCDMIGTESSRRDATQFLLFADVSGQLQRQERMKRKKGKKEKPGPSRATPLFPGFFFFPFPSPPSLFWFFSLPFLLFPLNLLFHLSNLGGGEEGDWLRFPITITQNMVLIRIWK